MFTGVILLILIVVCVVWWIRTNNRFKQQENKIKEASSGIEVALVNRYDLLTKLLDVAKGYAAHEKSLMTEVIQLRRGMSLQEMNEASAKMDALAGGIQLTAEAYPALRSSENFVQLQGGIQDAEAHLQAARRLYNSQVRAIGSISI